MRFTVKDHILYYADGVKVAQRPSPNHGGVIMPRLVVIHYTATPELKSPLSWLCRKGSGVSAHLVVDLDGDVYQLLKFNVRGWHAGQSEYDGTPDVNSFSIGIENVGLGKFWPVPQVEANRAIIEALYEAYPIEDVVGHEDVAPGRKTDPGPRYPWDDVTVTA